MSGLKNFSIADLEHFSGLNAHTLRTWELRYQFPKPQRLSSNVRAYSVDELKTVMDLALLHRNGFRISQMLTWSPLQILGQLNCLKFEEDRKNVIVNRMIISMYNLDIVSFEQGLADSFAIWPMATVVNEIIFPFLKRTKLLGRGNRLTEEHLAVTAIRKKMIWAIEKTDNAGQFQSPVILFLSGTRELDLALLYFHFQLSHAGKTVIYMGNDVTLENLEEVIEKYSPRFLYTYQSGKNKLDLIELANIHQRKYAGGKVIYTIAQGVAPGTHPNMISMDFEAALRFLIKPGLSGNDAG